MYFLKLFLLHPKSIIEKLKVKFLSFESKAVVLITLNILYNFSNYILDCIFSNLIT